MDGEVTGCSKRFHSSLFTDEVALPRKTSSLGTLVPYLRWEGGQGIEIGEVSEV